MNIVSALFSMELTLIKMEKLAMKNLPTCYKTLNCTINKRKRFVFFCPAHVNKNQKTAKGWTWKNSNLCIMPSIDKCICLKVLLIKYGICSQIPQSMMLINFFVSFFTFDWYFKVQFVMHICVFLLSFFL